MQIHVMHRCGVAQLRLVANALSVVTWNYAQSLPMAGRRYWREDPSRLMAASPLQPDFELGGAPALTTVLPSVPELRRRQGLVPETGGITAKVWHAKGQASLGEDGMPPEDLEQISWRQCFSDPTQWRDHRRSKPTPGHPDFRHKNSELALWLNNRHKPACVDSQLATWDAGMKQLPESVTSVQGQGPFGRLGAHGGRLEMCRKLCVDGPISDAFDVLNLLVQRGTHVPKNLFYRVLKRSRDLVLGRRIHALTVESGYEGDAFLATHLIGLYASHGRLEEAMRVFTNVSAPDAYNWATIIFAYAKNGKAAEAIRLYQQMRDSTTVKPTDCVFVAVLKACATAGDLVAGKAVHAHILASPGKPNIVVQTGLINMYANCGSLEDALKVFDRLPEKTVVTWNTMIAGYAQHGMGHDALTLYSSMQQKGIPPPSSVTFVCLLQACASVGVGARDQGKQLHTHIEERGLQNDVVLGGSLVNMYVKCSSLEDARRVFDRLPHRNVVAWNVMLAGYVQQGMGQEALTLYSSMQQEAITPPDSVTFLCVLQACAIVAALPLGKQLHADIEERGLQADLGMGAALVNMYAKGGSMFDAQGVFDSLPERTIEVWNALIGGYTRQGDIEVVFDLVHRMRLEGMQPDGITFLNVLTMCSHAGLVDKGQQYFEAMRTDYGIRPTVEHYRCMIDLLGRAGHLNEALQMATNMPFPPNSRVWRTLLGACRKWNNVEIGQQAFEFAVSVDGKDAASYVLMSNIYKSAQMWEEAKEMQTRRLKSGAWKKPGQSWWTDMGGVVHTFVVGDMKHPESEGIYARLQQLVPKMKKEGYVPHLRSSLHDIPDEDKEAELCGHSEKLAIAYALNKTPKGTTIRIAKNLRVCPDCHIATAYISKVEERTIICRDASRFHVYKEGKCSCGGYW